MRVGRELFSINCEQGTTCRAGHPVNLQLHYSFCVRVSSQNIGQLGQCNGWKITITRKKVKKESSKEDKTSEKGDEEDEGNTKYT